MALSSRGQMVLKNLTQLLNMGHSLSAAADQLRVMLNDNDLVDEVLLERQAIIESTRSFSSGSALVSPEEASGSWYTGPIDTDKFWPKLHAQLSSDPSWADAVEGLDETSTAVVSLLADPHSPQIATRGLVLGYVQSGKTANFTATIAKAADAGYRLIIVLSGVHNSLRRQTQLRLDEQLCDLNPTEWIQLTDDERDFGNPVRALPLVAGTQLRLLAVVKKNVTRLASLRAWLDIAHKAGGLDNCPVLIIDDEADQASPNSHKDPELDRTRINEEIVGLLALPRVAYVGYSATPFANVLANPSDPSDIYPRSFIYSLPKPIGYFGAEELFGLDLSERNHPDAVQGRDMIREVPPLEALRHAVSTKQPFVPEVTPSLATAIQWFVMATAARRKRSGQEKHSSMLIHTTMRVQAQLDYLPTIEKFVKELSEQWKLGVPAGWSDQWTTETSKESAENFGHAPIPFEDLIDGIPDVLRKTRVVADNSESQERLIYTDSPATVIAVGGNTLSRGLTLNGLVSSFFLRSAGAYDSVLQMGRWFGYRPGYEDLPRVWTTRSLASDFQFLSKIELEVRRDIDRYSANNMSPAELAVRIALHPRMKVTSKLKMHFAVAASASYSETRPQTTYFSHQNKEVSEKNLGATRRLLTAARAGGEKVDESESYVVIRNVLAEEVLRFLDDYEFNDKSEMSDGTLHSYVAEQMAAGSLTRWNLVVATQRVASHDLDLGLAKRINLISRSQISIGATDQVANIGTLMSRKDRIVDLAGAHVEDSDASIQHARNEDGSPLLVLYPIDKDSVPGANSKNRMDLDAVEHQVGVALVFPKAAEGTEPKDMIQVDLIVPPAIEVEYSDRPYEDNEGSRDDVQLEA